MGTFSFSMASDGVSSCSSSGSKPTSCPMRPEWQSGLQRNGSVCEPEAFPPDRRNAIARAGARAHGRTMNPPSFGFGAGGGGGAWEGARGRAVACMRARSCVGSCEAGRKPSRSRAGMANLASFVHDAHTTRQRRLTKHCLDARCTGFGASQSPFGAQSQVRSTRRRDNPKRNAVQRLGGNSERTC